MAAQHTVRQGQGSAQVFDSSSAALVAAGFEYKGRISRGGAPQRQRWLLLTAQGRDLLARIDTRMPDMQHALRGGFSRKARSECPRAQPPCCIAYEELAEGPIMLSNLLADDLANLRTGQPVQARFVASANGQMVPMFEPC